MKGKIKSRFIIIILIFLLISVRYFEHLLYDPFLTFFKTDFQKKELPEFNVFRLTISHVLRFGINTVLSLLIIYYWFLNKKIAHFCALLYIGVFVILFPVYLYFIDNNFPLGAIPTFYVRRFLIQPLVLLILIPAIYYYKKSSEKD